MPHSTIEFAFEEQVFAFACDHSQRHSESMEPFLLLVDDQGKVISTEFCSKEESTRHLSNREALLVDQERSHGSVFFDPFDWPEYAWLEWHEIDRAMMEQMIGRAFEESAFQSASGTTMAFPSRWSFMM